MHLQLPGAQRQSLLILSLLWKLIWFISLFIYNRYQRRTHIISWIDEYRQPNNKEKIIKKPNYQWQTMTYPICRIMLSSIIYVNMVLDCILVRFLSIHLQQQQLMRKVGFTLLIIMAMVVPLSLESPLNCSSSSFYSSTYSECRPCLSYCTACINDTVCQKCRTGYYLDNYMKCQICSTKNCFQCVGDICTACEEGYQYVRRQCLQATFRFEFMYIISGAFFALIIVLCFCCYLVRKCREQVRFRVIQNRVGQMPRQSSLAEIRFDQSWAESKDMQSKSEQICSFCLQASVNLQLSCSHLYHIDCIRIWLLQHPQCPICKRVVAGECRLYCRLCLKCSMAFDSRLITSSILEDRRVCEKCKSEK